MKEIMIERQAPIAVEGSISLMEKLQILTDAAKYDVACPSC